MVIGRVRAVSRDRRADVLDRVLGATALMLDQTEQMKGLGVTGVDGQDVTANPLRLRHLPRALMGDRRAEPYSDRRRWAACRAPLLSPPGSGAPLSSVHQTLIAQPDDAYPPCGINAVLASRMAREEGRMRDGEGSRSTTTKMAAMGERLAADDGRLRRAAGDGSGRGRGTADPGGPGPGLVLPPLGTLREPQPRPARHERQLCRDCRKRQCVLSRRPARTLSHCAPKLWPGRQSGPGCRPRPRPTALRQDRLSGILGRERLRLEEH